MTRYAAKLMFQYRVMVKGSAGRRRVCEDQIIELDARSARRALYAAKRKARAKEHSYHNDHGHKVHFEFVGVMELLCLEPCDRYEVWYEISERILPKERRSRWIPPEDELEAIWNES